MVVFQGLKIATSCRWLKYTIADKIEVTEDFERSVLEIKFPKGTKSSDIKWHRVELIEDRELKETNKYIKVETPEINFNGLKVKKLTVELCLFTQAIVKGIDSFSTICEEDRYIILIPERYSHRIDKYVQEWNKNPYFEVIDYSGLEKLTNFYNVYLSDKSVTIESSNEFPLNTVETYEEYILGMGDIQDSFRVQIEEILGKFGLQLVIYPMDKNVQTENHVGYRIVELGAQLSRKTADEEGLRNVIQHRSTWEFELSTPNLPLFTDFKNKFQNLDLLTNFTEFYTKDKLGENWVSAVRWGTTDSSFEHDHTQDSKGYYALRFTFQAEIYYYIVYDKTYNYIKEIVANLISKNIEGGKENRQTFNKIIN